MDDNTKLLATLSKDISEQVEDFVSQLEFQRGRPSLSQAKPDKAKEVLVLLATGTSVLQTSKATGVSYNSVGRIKSDFADYLGEWKEMGGKISGGLYVDASERISGTLSLIDEAERTGDWKAVDSLSKSLMAKNKIAEVSHRQATVSRGDVTERTATKQEKPDFDEMMKAVQELYSAKQAEVIDVE